MNENVKASRFPPSIFIIFLLVLLLMSGIHTGILVLMDRLKWNGIVQTIVPILYWSLVAIGLTLFTRGKIKKTYDTPMKQLAMASDKVAHGDFSVYIPTIHTSDKQDYLDVMITDFNKMVEELGSIETLKTDFFTNVSHEIKTPLAVIQNYAELLQRDALSEEERKEYAEAILYATKRLSNLITNMLKLNKLEKQSIQPVSEVYDVCRQLCDCVFSFEEVLDKKGIVFTADIEDRALIRADSGLMELVWSNLLSNALKFTEENGSVTLTQTSTADNIIVTITDTGCGMEEETLSHMFDKFYQGDTSHATFGNGLGLSLVQRIAELLDFSIKVKSVPGEGTSFTIILRALQ